jgi:hypothetical protein
MEARKTTCSCQQALHLIRPIPQGDIIQITTRIWILKVDGWVKTLRLETHYTSDNLYGTGRGESVAGH